MLTSKFENFIQFYKKKTREVRIRHEFLSFWPNCHDFDFCIRWLFSAACLFYYFWCFASGSRSRYLDHFSYLTIFLQNLKLFQNVDHGLRCSIFIFLFNFWCENHWNSFKILVFVIFFSKCWKVMKQQRAGDDAMSHEERMGEVAEKFSAKKSMKKISKPWKSHLFRCLLNSFSQFSEQFQNLFQDFANKYLSKMSSTFVFNFCSSKNVLILD